MKVIFLDIDGVLNHSECQNEIVDPKKIILLKKLVKLTNAKIVLSSSWRRKYDKDGNLVDDTSYKIIKKILKKYDLEIYSEIENYISNEVISNEITINEILNSNTDDNDRAIYIVKWLNNHPEVTSFVILDDFGGWTKYNLTDHVIRTNYWGGGLKDNHINEAINIIVTPNIIVKNLDANTCFLEKPLAIIFFIVPFDTSNV